MSEDPPTATQRNLCSPTEIDELIDPPQVSYSNDFASNTGHLNDRKKSGLVANVEGCPRKKARRSLAMFVF